MEIIFLPDRGSNPVRWTQSPILYHVTIKASLYCKALQVCYIPIPGDILPLQIEICPLISRESVKWDSRSLCTHAGYLCWAANVTGEKILITNAASGDQTRAVCVTGQHSTMSLLKPACTARQYKTIRLYPVTQIFFLQLWQVLRHNIFLLLQKHCLLGLLTEIASLWPFQWDAQYIFCGGTN